MTTSVVAQMTAKLACDAIRPTAMNCAEPANTASDINWPCQSVSGLAVTSVPKITPKGAAPIIIGMVSRAPAANSRNAAPEGCAGVAFKVSSYGSEDTQDAGLHACTFLRFPGWAKRSAPAAGRHAERSLEMAREMTLVGEAARRGDVGHGCARAQCRQRAHDTQLIAPCVRRETRFACEETRRVEGRETDRLREFGERDRFEQIVGESGFHRRDAVCVGGERRDVRAFQRVAAEQRRHGIDERQFRGERIRAAFQQPMRDDQAPRQIGISDDVIGKPGRRFPPPRHVPREAFDERHRQIEHAIAPARIDGPRARMQLAGIDHRHRARFGHVMRAAIVVAFRAGFDDGHRVGVVPVRREFVIVVLGRDHVRVGHERRAPVACGVAETVGVHRREVLRQAESLSLQLCYAPDRTVAHHFTGMVVPSGTGTAVTLFFGLPVATRSLYVR
ncbi:protein of unknown function [Caballeronia sp. S22]